MSDEFTYETERALVCRNAVPSVYGHAHEHKIGVYMRADGGSHSVTEAREIAAMLTKIADAIEGDQERAKRIMKLKDAPLGSVFRFTREDGRVNENAPRYIKLSETKMWSTRQEVYCNLYDHEGERTVYIIDPEEDSK